MGLWNIKNSTYEIDINEEKRKVVATGDSVAPAGSVEFKLADLNFPKWVTK